MFSVLKKRYGFSDLNFTSDCHCHLLPGVDDGIQEFGESVSVLRQMKDAGMKNVVLTPHINPDIFKDNNEPYLKNRYYEYVDALPSDIKDSVSLRLGAEYMVCDSFEKREAGELLQFKDGKVLIEMSYLYESKNIEDSIFNITMSGLTPVIAHPERYLYLTNNLERFTRFSDMGAEFQMNILSLSGAYGTASLKILDYLQAKGMYSHYGTDTHSMHHIGSIVNLKFDCKRLPHIK